ncbi:MAG: MobA/MobL family protein [Rhodocyclaceae bacterium]|nr:MobA/MobL family protein [Rhodocyclaceae bacterium]
MSIYHLNIKRGSRSENRLSVDKHDYIMRLGRFAERHDGELAHAESGNMPAWAVGNPRQFWALADERERANGTLYHEVEFALPRELTQAQQIKAARELTRSICGRQHPYSWGLHDKAGNPHVHLMFSGRQLDAIKRDADQFFKRYNTKSPEKGGCRKESSGDARGPEWVARVRQNWQIIANRHLAAAGHSARIDHRSHVARGIEDAPGVHLGRKVHRMEQAGKRTWRGTWNQERHHLNTSLLNARLNIREAQQQQRREQRAARTSAASEPAGGAIYVLDGKQRWKARILQKAYQQEISAALAAQLAFVDTRYDDRLIVGLNDGGRVVDAGDKVLTLKASDAEVQAAITLAQAKGWKTIHLTGSADFKARAWLQAARAGLQVTGYEPSPDLRAQLAKEKTMLGPGGAVSLTPDIQTDHQQTAAARRWGDALERARQALQDERKAAQARLAELKDDVDIRTLEKDLAAKHGGAEYRAARTAFRDADTKAKAAGLLTRKRAEAQREKAWQVWHELHAKALALPVAAQQLADAQRRSREREQLTESLLPIGIGVGTIEEWQRQMQKGIDPETEFAQAWKARKLKPLQRWQELAISPVFEADEAGERARQQAEADAAESLKAQARQVQAQSEIAAQKKVDEVDDRLAQPGLSKKEEAALQRQRRFHAALAAGYNEEEARERAEDFNHAPRPR